jgi:hypothetical protein
MSGDGNALQIMRFAQPDRSGSNRAGTAESEPDRINTKVTRDLLPKSCLGADISDYGEIAFTPDVVLPA